MGSGLSCFMQQRKETWKVPVQKKCGSTFTKYLGKNGIMMSTVLWAMTP